MKHFPLIIMMLMAVACGSNTDSSSPDDIDFNDNMEMMSLELPCIPEVISSMEGKAGYLATHFWDNLDFADTTRSLNVDFMERNFVEFLSILPAVMSADRVAAFNNMLKNASVSEDAYRMMVDMGDKYLMEPNSPMRNEDYYIDFLRNILADSVLSQGERGRYEYNLGEAMKVRPGAVAPDFRYVTRHGKYSSLRKTLDTPLVLIFTDPQCENCKEIMEFVANEPTVIRKIGEGAIRILSVYPDTDRKKWENPLHPVPSTWIDAMTVDEDIDTIYPIPAYPTIYLINTNGTIRLKDATPESLVMSL